MYKFKSLSLVCLLAIAAFFVGCDNKEKRPEIIVESESSRTQTMYADQTEGINGVTIFTAGAWSSAITEGIVKSVNAVTPTWLSINPSSGAVAGMYTIVISIEPNTTGADRTATITITCNGEEITIAVTQKATKVNGKDNEKQVTFDSKGGSAVQSQTVKEGEKAKEPEKPTKAVFAGLYAGTLHNAEILPDAYTFCGWYYGDTKWDFDTPITQDIVLTAKWLGEELARIEAVPANDVAKAIAYIIANPAEYTMFVDKDVNVAPQLIDISNVELTIIGLGGIERKIRLSSNGNLFSLGTWSSNLTGTSLTIGKDITLVGRTNNDSFMVGVYNGAELVMLDGSKITGNSTYHFASVVYIDNFGSFTMKGGTITGNFNTNLWHGEAAVHLNGFGSITIEGGSIIGNKGISDVTIGNHPSTYITLNGSATIDVLSLNIFNTSVYSSVVIGSDWTGSVGCLNILNSIRDMDTHIANCAGKQIVRAAARYTLKNTDIAKITLGNFLTESAMRPISEIYKIEDGGVDIGKLVAKDLSMKNMYKNVFSLQKTPKDVQLTVRTLTHDDLKHLLLDNSKVMKFGQTIIFE